MRSGARLAYLLGAVALVVLLGCGLAACLGPVRRTLAQGGVSAPLPPCPPPDSLGPGTTTPGPDDVSWDYLLECGHCLALTATPTSGWALATPTVGVRGFHADCPTDYALLKGGYAVTPLVLHDHVQHGQTYGAVFTVRYAREAVGYGSPSAAQDGYAPGAIPGGYTPLWLQSSPSYGALYEDGQTYCAVVPGHADLCAQFAPGAEVRLLAADGSYIPSPSLSAPLTLPVYLSETVDPFWFEDVQVLYYGEPGPACLIAPDVALDWRETCPEDVVVAHDGDFTHFEVSVGGTGWDYPADVYAVLFDLEASGAAVSLSMSGGSRNYFTTDIIGTALSEGAVCIGDAQVCTRLGPAGLLTIIEQAVVDVSEARALAFNVSGGVAGTIVLHNLRYGVYGDGQWSCVPFVPTPTPMPTWTPMGTGAWLGGWQSSTYTGTDWWSVHWFSFSAAGGGLENICGFLYRPVQCSNFKAMGSDLSENTSQDVDLGQVGCVYVPSDSDCGYLSTAQGCASVASGTENYSNGFTGRLPRTVFGTYSLQLQGGSFSGGKTCVVEAAPIYYGGGRPHPITPTPTLTPTVATAEPMSTPVPAPTLDPERCRVYAWKAEYDPAVEVAGDWEGLIEPGACYNVIPGLSITTPDLGAVGDLIGLDSYSLEWEGFEYCIMWVNFPSVSILGLSLSLEWFLLPAAAWLLNKLAEM